MSETVEELASALRLRAAKKRTEHFENFKKQQEFAKPANLAVVLAELTRVLNAISERLTMQAPQPLDADPVEFVVTERDAEGHVKSFRKGLVEFVVTERDFGGKVKSFRVERTQAQ